MVFGCSDGVQPDQREMVYFTAIETDTLVPQPVADPGTSLPADQVAAASKIVDGFVENHERLLQSPEVGLRIEQIENFFIVTGRFHELMVIYRDDWEQRGTKSHVADRFAWGLVRLGQQKRARQTVDALLADRPTDPKVHFLDGAVYLQVQPPPQEDFPKVVKAWRRVLQLDPGFKGYERIDAEALRAEIAKFDAATPEHLREAPPEPIVAPQSDAGTADADDAGSSATPQAVDTLPTEQPVADSPAPSEVEPAETPETEQPAQPAALTPDQTARLWVARGEIALGAGNYKKAEEAFIKAKALAPESFQAEFGHLRAGWGTESARNDVAKRMRELAEWPNLTPIERFDLGLFLWTKLGRKDLAEKQWEQAQTDPAIAARLQRVRKSLSDAPPAAPKPAATDDKY